MQVKLLKSGPYAFHGAWGPIVDFSVDEIYEGSSAFCEQLIADGWADKIEGSEPEEPNLDNGVCKTVNDLEALVAQVEDEDAKKTLIQNWGIEHFDVKVSKVKSVENMLLELRELESSE